MYVLLIVHVVSFFPLFNILNNGKKLYNTSTLPLLRLSVKNQGLFLITVTVFTWYSGFYLGISAGLGEAQTRGRQTSGGVWGLPPKFLNFRSPETQFIAI